MTSQELLPQLLTILRRGRDSAALYGILEGYLLLGGAAVLQGHEATLAAALQSTLSKLLQALAPPQPAQPAGSPASRPGAVSSYALATGDVTRVLIFKRKRLAADCMYHSPHIAAPFPLLSVTSMPLPV